MSKQVFDLIKSLNMSEKRHFKLFASKHVKGDKNNYVRLFDAIEKQNEYDEVQLIKSENYITSFSVLKARLYFTILKSLKAYNLSSSLRNRLKAEVDYVDILLNKGLTSQAKKILHKAMKTAEEFEFWDIWQELFSLEINLLKAENYRGKNLSDIDNRFTTFQEVLNKQSAIAENLLFEVAAFSTFRKIGQAKDLKSEQKFKDILKPFYVNNENLQSFSALKYNYQAKSIVNTAVLNYADACKYSEKLLFLMERHPRIIENYPKEYAKIIYNYILSILVLNKYAANIFFYLDKLKQIKFENEREQNQYLMMAFFIELGVYCHLGEFEKGTSLIEIAKKTDWIHLEKKNTYAEIINISIYYFIAYTYFGVGQYKESNKYLNSIINFNSAIGESYNRASKLFRIIVDFELGKNDSLEYSIKSAYRHLFKQHNVASMAEVLILKFLKQLMTQPKGGYQLLESFKELKYSLKKLENNRFERSFLSDFDYISWLESKISNRSFAEVVMEKAGVVANQ